MPRLPPLLPRSYFTRDALEVAQSVIGALVVRDSVVLRITEVEAYRYPGDTANHCRFGRTARNAPMWGPPGNAYVYLCYGIHNMLNLVTGPEGVGAAVLVRSCEIVAGEELVRHRRGGLSGPAMLTGPGKVGAALALDVSFSGHSLVNSGGLEIRRGTPPSALLEGPRVGVDYAEPEDRDAPWRIAAAGTPWVSQRSRLRPRVAR